MRTKSQSGGQRPSSLYQNIEDLKLANKQEADSDEQSSEDEDEEGMVSHSIASVARMKSDDTGSRPMQLDADTEEWARQGELKVVLFLGIHLTPYHSGQSNRHTVCLDP